MIKIGIIACKLRWDMGGAIYISYVNCFLACMNKKGNFKEINEPVIVAFASCNVCPGKGRFEKAEVMKTALKVDIIMFTSCCYKSPRCIHIDQSAHDIEEKLKIKVMNRTITREE